jgi:hypothetical protein
MKPFITSSVLFLCICLSFVSCKKSDDNNGSQAPIITGVNLTDVNAQPVGKEGSPNVLTMLNDNQILCYPKPCYNVLYVSVHSSQATTLKIWMVAAVYNNPPAGAKVENQSLYSQQSNPPINIQQAVQAGNKNILLQTDSLPNGFYKLYVAINTDTLYDNIWLSR